MVKATIRDRYSRVVFELNLPSHPREVTYAQYLELRYRSESIRQWLINRIEKSQPYQATYVNKLSQAIGSFLNVDWKLVKQLPVGKDTDTEPLGLMGIWQYLHNVVFAQYEPKLFSAYEDAMYEHNGEQYICPIVYRDAVTNQISNPDMTVQQIVESSTFEQQYIRSMEAIDAFKEEEIPMANGGTQPKHIAKATEQYKSDIHQIAIISHKPEEVIPTDHTFDKWLRERALALQDISMVNALNVLFFLTSTSKPSETTPVS